MFVVVYHWFNSAKVKHEDWPEVPVQQTVELSEELNWQVLGNL
jgi:hypothetical protein